MPNRFGSSEIVFKTFPASGEISSEDFLDTLYGGAPNREVMITIGNGLDEIMDATFTNLNLRHMDEAFSRLEDGQKGRDRGLMAGWSVPEKKTGRNSLILFARGVGHISDLNTQKLLAFQRNRRM